jgi:predicted RNase H-like nuclease (RuvC/YqgF family)
VLLTLSSISFSQTDTNRICFSYSKAKLIALDLVKGDSAIAELKVANKLIWQLNEKSNAQDSLVTLYVTKEQNYIEQITNYDQIISKQKTIITGLESDVEKLNRKNERLKKGLKWLGGGFVASILTVITLIAIK